MAVCANGFLYNMVRAIVGTLVYASDGKLAPGDIPALLEAGDRRLTGPTMPPQGLYMHRLWKNDGSGFHRQNLTFCAIMYSCNQA